MSAFPFVGVYETPIQNIDRKKPKKFYHDKEKQYEEILQLKSIINILNIEIGKLKTKNLNLEVNESINNLE